MNITIVGGGFGGVKTALELAKKKTNRITLISDRDTFQYYPALYSTATGHTYFQSWTSLGEIFGNTENVQVVIDTIEKIDPEKRQLRAASGTVYDYTTCVLALGSVTTYFGINGLDTYAFGVKTEGEIRRLKQHFFNTIANDKQIDTSYIIIGGGPTGVELAASMGEYLRRLSRKYHVKHRRINIRLIEAAPRVLPRSAEITSRKVEKRLKKLGVRVETGKMVQSADSKGIVVSGKRIDSSTVIWTSGVANHPFFEVNKQWFNFAPNHRVVVDEYMMAREHIYVIGDNAASKYGGLAQVAVQDAKFLADHLERKAAHRRLTVRHQRPPATVIPVGGWWAAFEGYGIRLYGWPAGIIRRIADFIGYNDILPWMSALAKVRSGTLIEDDYFPSVEPKK